MPIMDLRCDARTVRELGAEQVERLRRQLDITGECASCHQDLGTRAVSVVVDDLVTTALAKAHHHDCSPPQWRDGGVLKIDPAEQTTHTTLSFCVPGEPHPMPFVLAHPSLEVAHLTPTPASARGKAGESAESGQRWMVAPYPGFAGHGLTRAATTVTARRPAQGWSASIDADVMTIRLPNGLITWECDVDEEFVGLVARLGGFGLLVNSTLDPIQFVGGLVSGEEFFRVLRSPDTAAGFVGVDGLSRPLRPGALEDDSGRATPDLDFLRQKMFEQTQVTYHLSDSVQQVLGEQGAQVALRNVWPVLCQSCGDPLGSKADVALAGPLSKGRMLLTLHHATCRPEQATRDKPGSKMCYPTTSIIAAALTPGDDDTQHHPNDVVAVVVNPSCEHAVLEPRSGSWVPVTLEPFRALGFQAGRTDTIHHMSAGAHARLSDAGLVIETAAQPAGDYTAQGTWTVQIKEHMRSQVTRWGGVAVVIATTVMPARLGFDEIRACFASPSNLRAWVPLVAEDHPAPARPEPPADWRARVARWWRSGGRRSS